MMQKQIRRVFTSLREHTCVSYAKIATIGGLCDIDLTIVKATSPNNIPLLDKYIHEFLKIFSISSSSYRSFALGLARRLNKTKSWRVALKCLVLLHRLLHSLPEDGPLRAELLWTRTNGFLFLNPCRFRDSSSSASDDYTFFIRSYARLLDETLDCAPDFFQEIAQEVPKDLENLLPQKMKDLGRRIVILPHLQILIDRAVDCWPTGAAASNFLVQSAMKYIIRDSFTFYNTFRTEVVMVLDNLIQLPYHSCLSAFDIYKKAATQADDLSEFHDWCKSSGYCGSYGYPFIDRIPKIQIQALETFLSDMWELSDQSSSNISVVSPNVQSPLGSTEDDGNKREVRQEIKIDQEKKDVEIMSLIEWEVDSTSLGWEDLLEATISATSCMNSSTNLLECRTKYFKYGSCPTTPMHLLDV